MWANEMIFYKLGQTMKINSLALLEGRRMHVAPTFHEESVVNTVDSLSWIQIQPVGMEICC